MVNFHEVSVWYSSSQRRTSRPFLWFSVHIKADLHGRTGGDDCLPQNRIMNSRTGVSPLSIQPYKTWTSKEFLLLNLQIGFDAHFQCLFLSPSPSSGEISFWIKLIESEVKTALDLRVAETTNNKKPKLLILQTNCSFFNPHLNWQLWNIHIKETAVYKKTYWESISVFNDIAVTGFF